MARPLPLAQVASSAVGGAPIPPPDAPPTVHLSPVGEIVERTLLQLNDFYQHIELNQYIIMPNHVHLLLFIYEDKTNDTVALQPKQHSSVSQFVSTFKRFSNKDCNEKLWQRHFHDHVIRNQKDYEEHVKYIYDNPLKWLLDETIE